ncbi:MAG: phosphomethylpyrimidine synthase ThiC [Firmicutes bacterium]|nr:phosphomethylpyrimidine synthase ThiC [Bacillota bacterium]
MTQLLEARAGRLTPAIRRVAEKEKQPVERIAEALAAGETVIPANVNHAGLDPEGVGKGLRTKVNANLGTSPSFPDLEPELIKLEVAVAAGADAVMDLSTGGDIDAVRRAVLAGAKVPVGTVPIYQAAAHARDRSGDVTEMTPDDLFRAIELHASDGVDFITVHCGVTREAVQRLESQPRVIGVVSRGGALLINWMMRRDAENPLYEQFDRLLEIAKRHDVTLSLGDGLRPGSVVDATDRGQIAELLILGELVAVAREAGVQVMVEGPGHVPLDQVAANVQIQKRICHGAPFYVLGPLVTDVAPGYDHITSAIGGALAASAGADFLCYVTPAEHLGLPCPEDVREGVIAARIAGHAADLVKGVPGAWEWDRAMSKARKSLQWERQIALAIDPVKAERVRAERNPGEIDVCTMCGQYCAMKIDSGRPHASTGR